MDRRRSFPLALSAIVLLGNVCLAQDRAPLALPRIAAKAGQPVIGVQHEEAIPFLPPPVEHGTILEDAHASCPTPPPKDVRCPTIYGFADALYLTVRGSDLPFAQPRDGVGPLAVPRGAVGIVDPDYAAGFRVGMGIALGEGTAIQGTLTWWENASTEFITAPAGTVLRSLVVFPATLNAAADSLNARSRQDINLRLADIDYRHCLSQGTNHYFGYLVGGRYAHLTQDSRSEFSILGATTVTTLINFDGVGGRAGLEGEYRIGRGFYTYGKGIVSLLGGHFGSTYIQTNVFAGLQASTAAAEDRVVPILDLEVGGGWSSSKGRVRIQGGYFLSSWNNTLTTPGLIQGVQNTNFTTNGDNFRDNLTFDGLSLRIEFRY